MGPLSHASTVAMLWSVALGTALATATSLVGAQSLAQSGTPSAGAATIAPQGDSGRVAATGGLAFVQDPAIVLESQDVVIGPGEIKVTYVLRNTAAVEHAILAAFALPELDMSAIGDQPVKLASPQAANFVAATFNVDGVPALIEIEQRAQALGLDVTAQLAAHQVTLQPLDPAIAGQIRRLPRVTKTDFLQRGILRAEDARFEPNWTLKTTTFWRQAFPPRQLVTIELNYRPVSATAAYQPALLEAVRPTHCLDGAADAAITRKIAAQGGKVAFTWTSYVPGGGSSLLGPARQFRLRLEKRSIDTVVVTCRRDFRPLGPTTQEWAAQNYLEEDLHVLFID